MVKRHPSVLDASNRRFSVLSGVLQNTWFRRSKMLTTYLIRGQQGFSLARFFEKTSTNASRSFEFIARKRPKMTQEVKSVQSSKKSQMISRCGRSKTLCTMFKMPCGNSTRMKTIMTRRIILVVLWCCLSFSALLNRADISRISFSCFKIRTDIMAKRKQGTILQTMLNHQKFNLNRGGWI